jgi:hypothetical protein
MKTLIVLFNLKNDISMADYEKFAQAIDIPTVKSLKSIDDFKLYKSEALLGSEMKPPYAYFEVIDINDMTIFGEEVSTETMQKVAAQFQAFADNPMFILTEKIG